MALFNERLVQARKNQKSSQAVVASGLGIARSTLAQWETGDREPSFEMIEKLADYFKVPLAYFFTETDVPRLNALAEKYGDLLSSPEIQAVMDELSLRSEDERRQIAQAILSMLKVSR